jgi:hypothetical protein
MSTASVRALVVLGLALVCASCASLAPAPYIERLQIVAVGLGEVSDEAKGTTRIRETLHNGDGERLLGPREYTSTPMGTFAVTKATHEVPRILGTTYGVRFVVIGSPAKASAEIKTVHRTRHIITSANAAPFIVERRSEQVISVPIGIERGGWARIHQGIIKTIELGSPINMEFWIGKRKLADVEFKIVAAD